MGWLTMDDFGCFMGKAWFGPGSGPKPKAKGAPKSPVSAPQVKPMTRAKKHVRRASRHAATARQGVPAKRFWDQMVTTYTRIPAPIVSQRESLRMEERLRQRTGYSGQRPNETDDEFFERMRQEQVEHHLRGGHRGTVTGAKRRSLTTGREVSLAPVPGSWEWHHARTDYDAIRAAALARSPHGRPTSAGGGTSFAMTA